MLFQIQIINKKQEDENGRPILAASLAELDVMFLDVYCFDDFLKLLTSFFQKNKKRYQEHLEIMTKLYNKKAPDEFLEIAYYFTPSSIPDHILHYAVEINTPEDVFTMKKKGINKFASKIFEHFLKIKDEIIIDNGDNIADLTLENFNKINSPI